MEFTLANLLMMAGKTVIAPRAGAAWVMRQNPSSGAAWQALVLLAVASAFLLYLYNLFLPETQFQYHYQSYQGYEQKKFVSDIVNSPLLVAILQLGTMVISVHALHKAGSWFDGTGTLKDSVLLITWSQFILLCLQVIQFVALLLSPLTGLFGILTMGLMMWLMINFIAELHGFISLAHSIFVFVVFAILVIVAAFAMSLVFVLFYVGGATGHV